MPRCEAHQALTAPLRCGRCLPLCWRPLADAYRFAALHWRCLPLRWQTLTAPLAMLTVSLRSTGSVQHDENPASPSLVQVVLSALQRASIAFVQVVLRKIGRGSRAVVGRLVRAPRKGSVVVI